MRYPVLSALDSVEQLYLQIHSLQKPHYTEIKMMAHTTVFKRLGEIFLGPAGLRIVRWPALLLTALLLQMPTLAYATPENATEACKFDRLEIDLVRQLRPSDGLDDVGRALISNLLEEVIQAPYGIGFSKAEPLLETTKFIAEKAFEGVKKAAFEEVIDEFTNTIGTVASDEDNLTFRVNGKKLFGRNIGGTFSGASYYPPSGQNSASIFGQATIQLVEYDLFAPNDDLGRLVVEDELAIVGRDGELGSDARAPINQQDVTIESEQHGSLYQLRYSVIPGLIGGGGIDDMPERVMCGYSECWDATEDRPANGGVTRGGPPALACPAGYRLATNDHNKYRDDEAYPSDNLYRFGREWDGAQRLLTMCELIPDCGERFDLLNSELIGGPENLRDGDIIVMKTALPRDRSESDAIVGDERVYFYGSREGGQYLGVAPGIGKNLARVHVMDPNREDAQWRVSHLPTGEILLQSVSTGAYMTRCLGCAGIDGNSLKVDTYEPSSFGGIMFGDRGSSKYDLVMGRGQWNIGAHGYNPVTDEYDEANGINVSDLPGYKYLARPIPSKWNPGWTVYVKNQDQPAVVIEPGDSSNKYDFKNRSLLVNPGARYVLEGDVLLGRKQTVTNNGTLVVNGSLTVDSLAGIQNMGTIEVKGSIILDGVLTNEVGGTLLNNPDARYNLLGSINGGGELQNKGRLENEGVIRVASVSNSGIILDLSRGGFISAIIQNTGEVYTRDRTFGSSLDTNAVNSAGGRRILDARFFSASGFGCSGIGRWEPATLTCEEVIGLIPTGDTWVVGEGVTLDVSDPSSRLVMDGTLINYGEVAGFENIEACDGALTNFNGDQNYDSAGFAACAVSEQKVECEKFVGGVWNDLTKVCVADGYRKDSEQEFSDEFNEFGFWSLVIPDGVTYKLYYLSPDPLIEGYRQEDFSIVVQQGGTLVTQYVGKSGFGDGRENQSSGTILNYGTIDLGESDFCNAGNCGILEAYLYLANVSLENYGVVSSPIELEYSSVRNYCGGSVNLYRPEFDTNKIAQEVPCAGQDFDGDGVDDFEDFDPLDPSESLDSDGDGVGDNADVFPEDASETADTDGDGVGDIRDFAPLSKVESADSDGDGVGDNSDFAPMDPFESVDTDGDGVGDNSDFAPNDPGESADADGDGIGDNADTFPNASTAVQLGGVSLTAALGDSDSACSIVESEFIPYRSVATPDASVATDAMSTAVNFALEGCDSSGETVQITIDMGSTLPPNAAVYKVIDDKWTVIPGATINGSIVSYSITDNDGFLDQDPAMGRISDPVSVAVPRAGGNPNAIPAVPFLGLMALAILIALWGAADLTRSRPSVRQ